MRLGEYKEVELSPKRTSGCEGGEKKRSSQPLTAGKKSLRKERLDLTSWKKNASLEQKKEAVSNESNY